MSEAPPPTVPAVDPAIEARLRPLARLFAQSDLVKLRIRDAAGEVVLRGPARARGVSAEPAPPSPTTIKLDPIKAELVGIMHLARPVPALGALIDADSELGYVESLGIRNSVRSGASGRLAAVNVADGQAVDYGYVLFTIDRNR